MITWNYHVAQSLAESEYFIAEVHYGRLLAELGRRFTGLPPVGHLSRLEVHR